jgi:uncharacterized protein YcbK (DUF882 family)
MSFTVEEHGMFKSRTPQADQACLHRRRFLKRASLLVGTGSAVTWAAAQSSSTDNSMPRTLDFVHTHTGEALSVQYSDGINYIAKSLRDVNHLLRDFRSGETHVMDPTLLDILYELRQLADRDAPYEIISGFRSPTTNAMLRGKSKGVAEHSQHILGKAIDVRLRGFSTRRLGEYARSLARGGVGYYAGSDFVHLDTGRVRFWQR